MHISDLTKDIRRVLLEHWTEKEINERLMDPDYFFDQVVNPHFESLRRQGSAAPRIRLQKTPTGEKRAILLS